MRTEIMLNGKEYFLNADVVSEIEQTCTNFDDGYIVPEEDLIWWQEQSDAANELEDIENFDFDDFNRCASKYCWSDILELVRQELEELGA